MISSQIGAAAIPKSANTYTAVVEATSLPRRTGPCENSDPQKAHQECRAELMISIPMDGIDEGLPMDDLDQETNEPDQYQVHGALQEHLIHSSEIRNPQIRLEDMPYANRG